MKAVELKLGFMDDSSLVARFTEVMMECCPDFPKCKADYASAISQMNQLLGDQTVQTLTAALPAACTSDIRFAFARGFQYNIRHFRHSMAGRKIEADFDNLVQEDIMIRMPKKTAAMQIIDSLAQDFSGKTRRFMSW